MLWRDGWDTKAQRLAVFESFVACRPNAALHVLVASSVHGVEPLGHVLDAVELGRFSAQIEGICCRQFGFNLNSA